MKLNSIILLLTALFSPAFSDLAPIIQPELESIRALVDSEVLFGNGIKIELKKGTKLKYPSVVNEHDIPFILLGAARFKVLNGYRLTVEYNEIFVKATAASFSIEKGNGTIEINVIDNQVSLITDQQQLVVRAFQRATYNVLTKRISIIDKRIKRT
jgi:hypothetical protein